MAKRPQKKRKPCNRRSSGKRKSRAFRLSVRQQWLCALLLVVVIAWAVTRSHRYKNNPGVPAPGTVVQPADPQPTRTGGTADEKETVSSSVSAPAGTFSSVTAAENWKQGLEIPLVYDSTYLIQHPPGNYALKYNPLHRQAEWVAYLLTRSHLESKNAQRTKSRFIADPHVGEKGWESAHTSDYTRSGFDRGHLLPSADRTGSQEQNQCTFYLSNISPQHPNLNRKTMNRLEGKVRSWALQYDSLYIVCGPVLSDSLPTIGRNRISIPSHFYKVVLLHDGADWQAVGFLLPNCDTVHSDFSRYARPVSEIEQATGIDFFAAMPDTLQYRVETTLNRNFWFAD